MECNTTFKKETYLHDINMERPQKRKKVLKQKQLQKQYIA